MPKLDPLKAAQKIRLAPATVSGKYFVPRTSSKELPVYKDVKHQGSQIWTIVRKIWGDSNALKNDLSSALKIKPELISSNETTSQIKIKGDYVQDVKQLLATKF